MNAWRSLSVVPTGTCHFYIILHPALKRWAIVNVSKSVELMQADDAAIADWARHHGSSIVSKDTDFYQRSVALGSPPKFIWLRVGNCRTEIIVDLLRSQHALIRDFLASETESVLVLDRLPQER